MRIGIQSAERRGTAASAAERRRPRPTIAATATTSTPIGLATRCSTSIQVPTDVLPGSSAPATAEHAASPSAMTRGVPSTWHVAGRGDHLRHRLSRAR
jgi:hypothetical protein